METVGRSVVVSLKGFVEDSERLIEEVCCTAQGDVNLLESLLPSSLPGGGFENGDDVHP